MGRQTDAVARSVLLRPVRAVPIGGTAFAIVKDNGKWAAVYDAGEGVLMMDGYPDREGLLWESVQVVQDRLKDLADPRWLLRPRGGAVADVEPPATERNAGRRLRWERRPGNRLACVARHGVVAVYDGTRGVLVMDGHADTPCRVEDATAIVRGRLPRRAVRKRI